MNRILSIVFSGLFIIAVIGFIVMFKPNEPLSPEQIATEATAKTYENSLHGFSLAYPEELNILEYTPEIATIGTLTEGGIDGVVDIRVETIEGQPDESLTEAAARQLSLLCAADGPTQSFTCTGLKSAVPFVTISGTTGFKIFLHGELTDFTTGSVTEIDKGPYLAFVLSTSATATKVLVIHPPLNQSAEEANRESIESIAKTVRIRQ